MKEVNFSHFSGVQYSLGRIPIASCDFSTRNYSYDNVDGDFSLEHFALALDDYQYKVQYFLAMVMSPYYCK